jgi:hypothetical protein
MMNMKFKYNVKQLIWGKQRLNKPVPAVTEDEDQQPDFEKLRRDAMKSLFVLPEVQKTDDGFEVV